MLDIHALSHAYAGQPALDAVDFTVPGGSIVGFVGRNGAGKTTAMRAIMALLVPDAGTVLWGGSPPTSQTRRRRFGYMPEERGLYPKMRVLDQLVYLGRLAGMATVEAREQAREWADRLGVGERGRDNVEALSLGNQQRVQLAAALLHRPDLLVLDEPFSGLDPLGVDVMAGVLRAEAGRGASVLFSSHQLELVEQICDRVVILEAGRVVADGTIAGLRGAGPRRWRIGVDGDPPALAQALADVSGARAWRTDADGTVLVELADGGGAAPLGALLDAARAVGTVRHFAEDVPSLAELYREVVTA
ncbi:MAG: ATP-binding cassette domain-containing protein [Actinobacteria bacterium]|nr:ATP-binding cassette domain-containing protein [Actinomycetota bacterium]